MKEGIDGESTDEDGPPANELGPRTPKGGAEHKANQKEGEYEVTHFPGGMKVTRNDRHSR